MQMKVVEIVKIARELLKLMSEYGVKVGDQDYVDVYEDFVNMRMNRVKYRSAIRMLAEERKISTRTLERIFRRLSKNVK